MYWTWQVMLFADIKSLVLNLILKWWVFMSGCIAFSILSAVSEAGKARSDKYAAQNEM